MRRRMTVAERERHIVDGAIKFFAEHGFDAQMRELASAIGVTHTLVYHYFPTKQALVDRVYLEVFEGRWKPEWEVLLDDRTLSVEEKFLRFYVDYARTVLTKEFVRILIFSGLTDRSITDRFFGKLGERGHVHPGRDGKQNVAHPACLAHGELRLVGVVVTLRFFGCGLGRSDLGLQHAVDHRLIVGAQFRRCQASVARQHTQPDGLLAQQFGVCPLQQVFCGEALAGGEQGDAIDGGRHGRQHIAGLVGLR